MRIKLFSLLTLQLLFGSLCSAVENKYHEEVFIRRAYLDVLGVVPTIEEIEWYTVYNKNGYCLAVDFILSNPKKCWNIDNTLGRVLLMSETYKTLPNRTLTRQELDKCVVYVVGNLNNDKIKDIKESYDKLLQLSQLVSDDPLDRIDYICNCLMSRSTTTQEANKLMSFYRKSNALFGEEQTWYLVLEEILHMPSVCNK